MIDKLKQRPYDNLYLYYINLRPFLKCIYGNVNYLSLLMTCGTINLPSLLMTCGTMK